MEDREVSWLPSSEMESEGRAANAECDTAAMHDQENGGQLRSTVEAAERAPILGRGGPRRKGG